MSGVWTLRFWARLGTFVLKNRVGFGSGMTTVPRQPAKLRQSRRSPAESKQKPRVCGGSIVVQLEFRSLEPVTVGAVTRLMAWTLGTWSAGRLLQSHATKFRIMLSLVLDGGWTWIGSSIFSRREFRRDHGWTHCGRREGILRTAGNKSALAPKNISWCASPEVE